VEPLREAWRSEHAIVSDRRVVAVTSSGGVLLDMLALLGRLEPLEVRWVAVPMADTRASLEGNAVTWVRELTTRTPLGVLRALPRAIAELRRWRPDAVISAGTGVAVPYFVAARRLGIRSAFLETYNLRGRAGAAARACGALATVVLVQHATQLREHRRALLVGALY
jgi:hypothetical protein